MKAVEEAKEKMDKLAEKLVDPKLTFDKLCKMVDEVEASATSTGDACQECSKFIAANRITMEAAKSMAMETRKKIMGYQKDVADVIKVTTTVKAKAVETKTKAVRKAAAQKWKSEQDKLFKKY